MSTPSNIILVGCGKMGSALLQGWINADIQASFSVIEPHDCALADITHFKSITDAKEALNNASAIILAVKPQAMDDVCAALSQTLPSSAMVLSIAAGKSIESFKNHFGSGQPIVRAMPNTPAAIGKGMSVAVPNTHISEEQKALAHTLLSSTGKTEWLEDENLLDAVTALSGSGPAYVFHLIEVLAKSGESIGLSNELSMTLARQTVVGAAALAESEAKTPASTLRENVTSPGGTTEAALKVLMNGKMQGVFDEALHDAKKRGRELNK